MPSIDGCTPCAKENRPARPEHLYKRSSDPSERQRLKAEVVAQYRKQIASVARREAPAAAYRGEAEHVGAIGLLIALEKFEPSLLGEDRGAAFWYFAAPYVRHEIQKWIGVGVYWRKSANRGKSESRRANRAQAEAQRTVVSLDAALSTKQLSARTHSGQDHVCNDETLLDLLESPLPSVEDLVSDAQSKACLLAFVRTLNVDDADLLLSNDPRRVRSRHYLILMERARAFVKGGE